MKIIIAGNSGMIGSLVLKNCLNSDQINEVISLVRKPSKQEHKKLKEVVITDFSDYRLHEYLFKDIHAAYFCLGVYTGQVTDEVFKIITVDYAVAFAKMLEKHSPQANMCLLSGAGADRTERSKLSFARFKGMAENQIAQLKLNFCTFRPGYIYPVESRKEPNLAYSVMKFLYPVIRLLGKKYAIKSTELANAMFQVGLNGASEEILENLDILKYSNNSI